MRDMRVERSVRDIGGGKGTLGDGCGVGHVNYLIVNCMLLLILKVLLTYSLSQKMQKTLENENTLLLVASRPKRLMNW